MASRIPQFKEQDFENKNVSQLQDNVRLLLDPLSKSPILDNNILIDVSLVTGKVNKIPHKLQRGLIGWQVIDLNASSTIWRDSASSLSDPLFLNLRTTSNCTVRLYVF